jgi:hypothetical protein
MENQLFNKDMDIADSQKDHLLHVVNGAMQAEGLEKFIGHSNTKITTDNYANQNTNVLKTTVIMFGGCDGTRMQRSAILLIR